MNKTQLTKPQALQKLKHYCAFQERCHQEVNEKLSQLGVWKKERDEITASLIEDGYLDEERFARAFAGGKFRVKHWGRIKIRHELRQRQVSEYSIKKALKEIDEDAYIELVRKLFLTKYESLKYEPYFLRKKKTFDYLLQKGFEANIINVQAKTIARP